MWAAILIALSLVGILGIDYYLFRTNRTTISSLVRWLGSYWPMSLVVVIFAMGALAGHFFLTPLMNW